MKSGGMWDLLHPYYHLAVAAGPERWALGSCFAWVSWWRTRSSRKFLEFIQLWYLIINSHTLTFAAGAVQYTKERQRISKHPLKAPFLTIFQIPYWCCWRPGRQMHRSASAGIHPLPADCSTRMSSHPFLHRQSLLGKNKPTAVNEANKCILLKSGGTDKMAAFCGGHKGVMVVYLKKESPKT